MTQTVQAKCPHCRNVLRIPSEWLNKSMRCKHCKNTFQAKAKDSDAVTVAAPGGKSSGSVPVAKPANAASTAVAAILDQKTVLAAGVAAARVPVAAILDQKTVLAAGVAAGSPPAKSSGDPFSFDDAAAPEPAGASTPRRRGNGNGTLVLVLMFFFLFVLGLSGAGYAIYKVVNTPQLAQGDNVKSDSAAIKPSERPGRPTADGSGDKGNGTKENPDPVTPPADDAKKDKDLKKINPPLKDKDNKKKDNFPPKDFVKKDGPKKPPIFNNDPFPRRALLISVNNYLMFNPVHFGSPRDQFKNGYPGSSISVLRDRLTSLPMNFRPDQVVELSDAIPRDSKTAKAHPTQKSVIETTIKDFLESCRDQDRIMVFYAGHATHLEDKKSYLIPVSGNVTDPDSLVPLDWVYDQLAKCKAQQKILVLDVFRYSPGRGSASASGGEGEEGTMPEDFDKNVLNPPAGVQVWCACQKEQNSVELEGGSAFMQAICHAMQGGAEMRGIADPKQPIPIENMVESVNKRLKDLLTPEKRTQVSRLTGMPSANEVAYDKTQPLPDPLKLKPLTVQGGNVAGLAQINKMLDEIKVLPPVREARAGDRDLLSAEMLPPFSVKNLDAFKPDGYQNIGDLHKRYVNMKGKKEDKEAFDKEFPLRGAYFEIVEALNESGKITMREVLRSPFDPKQKVVILKEQEPLGMSTFRLEQTLAFAKAAAKERDKETSKRWHANFDFALARLESRMVYLIEYNYTLGRIRVDDLPELAPGQSGWRIGTGKKIAVTEKKAKDLAKETKAIWNRIISDYPDTPWALLAQREREIALGVQWRAKSD